MRHLFLHLCIDSFPLVQVMESLMSFSQTLRKQDKFIKVMHIQISRSNTEFAPFLDLRGWEIWFVLWPSWRDTSENVWESLFFHRLGHISVLFAFEWRFFRRWPACHREQQVRIVQSNVLHWSCIVSNAALKLITTNACDPHSKRREQLHGNLALVRQFWRFVGKWFLGPSYWTRRKP